ncbi:hypothetical protein BC497_29605 (plasmid) [Klebsiella variicola]|uniref:type IV secretory system conjugative DNA transfer family protein n=1 Tax=Klebsiella variicola TaxID=244366 RepID=UPI000E35A114|nr:hypothetical protein BC497_29605 [Klebsiella variicola]
MGHKCFCFQPESFSSHRYNPLDYVNRDQDFRVGDIKAFASILYDPREDHKTQTGTVKPVTPSAVSCFTCWKARTVLPNAFAARHTGTGV